MQVITNLGEREALHLGFIAYLDQREALHLGFITYLDQREALHLAFITYLDQKVALCLEAVVHKLRLVLIFHRQLLVAVEVHKEGSMIVVHKLFLMIVMVVVNVAVALMISLVHHTNFEACKSEKVETKFPLELVVSFHLQQDSFLH